MDSAKQMANKMLKMSTDHVNNLKLKMDALSTANLPESEREYYQKKIEELKAINKSINFSGDNSHAEMKLNELMNSLIKK
jgi:hypothetical protein